MQPRLRRNPWTPLATALAFASLASGAEEEPPSAALPAAPVKIERAGPGNVLVVYNENAPDGREIADYYAKRRGVPEENLLGLRVPPKTDTNYRQFFESMLKPLREKLSSKAADGVAFSERIL